QYQTKDEEYVNQTLLAFAKKHNVPYFAANNNYYLDKKGAFSRDILIGVKEGLNFNDENGLNELKNNPRVGRLFFPTNEFYFKSPAEMAALFSDMPEALENTNLIVDKVEQFKLGREVLLPKFEIATEFIESKTEEINQSLARIVSFKEQEWTAKNYTEDIIELQ